MKVTLLQSSPEPIKAIYLACRTCYSQKPPTELEQNDEAKMMTLIRRTLASGHHSVLEHATFSFSIEGVSRALTHQLVRHRIASYAQQSQRYVDFSKTDAPAITIPPKIKGANLEKFEAVITEIYSLYKELVADGIEPEDARYILPNAAHTNIIVTMNYRELINFSKLRLCFKSQWEIQHMTREMRKAVSTVQKELAEFLEPKCQHLGYCDEKDPCGHYVFSTESEVVRRKVREKWLQ